MNRAVALFLCLAVALAGCSSAYVSGQSNSFVAVATPPGGASISSGSISYSYASTSAAGAIAALAVFAALTGIWRDPPYPYQRSDPPMLEGRPISVVDCTQPIEDWSKNLTCR